MLDDFGDELGPYDDLEPAEGARKALEVLRSPATADERGEAAIFLGSLLDLVDEDETFDFGVPVALGRELREALWAIHDDPSEPELVRRRCLEALVRWPIDPVPDAVRRALDTPGPWHLTGLFCAGFVTGFEEDVRAALVTGTLEERIEAWRATANLELEDLGPRALDIAGDPDADREERIEAIGALAWIGDPGAAVALLEGLTEGEDEELVTAAEDALTLRAATDAEDWGDDEGEGLDEEGEE